jgi:uncharacterized phage-associated protein
MPYSAKSIANFFLELARVEGSPVTPMKLQKLVYYAHGWYSGHTEKPLIDETVEAWQYGPVIESLYHEFKTYGAKPIETLATELNIDELQVKPVSPPSEEPIRKFLKSVWNSYSKFTGLALSEMTHASGSPWDITWKSGGGIKGKDIPQELIVSHFKEAVVKAKAKADVKASS